MFFVFIVFDVNEAESEASEYRVTIAYSTSESDLEKLDSILESIQKVIVEPVAEVRTQPLPSRL